MQAEQIKTLLPVIYQQTCRPNGPLNALLESMEVLQEQAETAVEHFPRLVNPRLTADKFLPMLAKWIDMEHLFPPRLIEQDASVDQLLSSGAGRLRELIANASLLARWRGTRRGLTEFLQIATGLSGFAVDEHVNESGLLRPFHICVRGPEESEQYRPLIERIIHFEKPAHLTFEFVTSKMDKSHGDYS